MGIIDVLIAGHTLIGSISVILNAFLLFTIILVSPKTSRAFAILMGATALWDVIGALAGLMCMSRALTLEGHVILISHGPCMFISSSFCFLSYDLFLVSANATYYTTLASFIARLMILRNGSINKQTALLLLATCVLWHTIAVFIILGGSKIADDIALELVTRNIPEYSHNGNIMATESIYNFNVAYPLIHVSVIIFPVYIIIWSLSLKRRASLMSNSTLNYHERIVKILTLQSVIPFFAVFCILLFILRQITQVRNPLIETSSPLILEFASIFNPIIVFVNLPAYKRVIQQLFQCATIKVFVSNNTYSSDDPRRHVVVQSAERIT